MCEGRLLTGGVGAEWAAAVSLTRWWKACDDNE